PAKECGSPPPHRARCRARGAVPARQIPPSPPSFVAPPPPPFSISLHGGQRDLRERWTPLFEKYGVAAVFSGHDHVYERAEVGGVRYFVSGGGGAPLYPRKARPSEIDAGAVKFFERVNHYLRVHVVGDQIEVAAIRVDGTPIETTTWGEAPRAAPQVGAAGGPSGAPQGAMAAPAAVSFAPPPVVSRSAPSSDGAPDRSTIGWTVAVGALLVLGALAALWRAMR